MFKNNVTLNTNNFFKKCMNVLFNFFNIYFFYMVMACQPKINNYKNQIIYFIFKIIRNITIN